MCLAPLFYLKHIGYNETKLFILHFACIDILAFFM